MSDFNLNDHVFRLLQAEPFFAALSRRIEKKASTAVPTAGVRVDEHGYFEMIYNPAFFAGLTDEQRTGVLVHEFYHLVFEHVTGRLPDERAGAMHGQSTPEQRQKFKIWNIAADLSINYHIGAANLPENCCIPGGKMFEDMPGDMTAEWYYDKLLQKMEDQENNANGDDGDSGDGSGGSGGGAGSNSPSSSFGAGFGTNSLITKEYADALKSNLDIKDSVRVATTANISLSGTQTIDGASTSAGDRVLVKDQSTAADNGIYVVASGTWARATDADSSAKVTPGMFVFVELGTAGGDNGYVLTNDSVTLGSTALVFTQFSGAGQIVAGDAMTKSGNTLNVAADNKTLQINSDTVRIKGIGATAVGDILLGQASDGGFTAHAKPGSSATAYDYILTMNTSGAARWANTLDGGTF